MPSRGAAAPAPLDAGATARRAANGASLLAEIADDRRRPRRAATSTGSRCASSTRRRPAATLERFQAQTTRPARRRSDRRSAGRRAGRLGRRRRGRRGRVRGRGRARDLAQPRRLTWGRPVAPSRCHNWPAPRRRRRAGRPGRRRPRRPVRIDQPLAGYQPRTAEGVRPAGPWTAAPRRRRWPRALPAGRPGRRRHGRPDLERRAARCCWPTAATPAAGTSGRWWCRPRRAGRPPT